MIIKNIFLKKSALYSIRKAQLINKNQMNSAQTNET